MTRISSKSFFVLIVLMHFGLSFSHAQENTDTVFYKMVYDDPTFSYAGIGASFDVSLNDHNLTLAAFGLGGTYYSYDKKILATVRSRFHVGEGLTDFASKGQPALESVYETEKSRDITIGGTYLFKQDIQKVESFITVDKKRNVDYVAEVEALEATQYGGGVGVRFMSTYYNFGSSDKLTGVLQDNGEELSIDKVTASYLTQQVLRLSFSRLKVQEFEILTDKFGHKMSSVFSRVYGGLQFAMNQRLDDVLEIIEVQNGQSVEEIGYRYSLNETVDLLPVGLFVGFEALSGLKAGWGGSIGTRLEAGLMPGPTNFLQSNLYLDLSFFFEFGNLFNE